MREFATLLFDKTLWEAFSDDPDFMEAVRKKITTRTGECILSILDTEGAAVISKSEPKVIEHPLLDCVDYRVTIKYQPVVRCHDCIYWHGWDGCKCPDGLRSTSDECFCYFGKRKDKANE